MPVLVEGDIEGAACETRLKLTFCRRWSMFGRSRATEQRVAPHAKSSFDPLIRSFEKLTCCFCRGDEPWSSHRPGIVYIVPTRYAIVDDFKAAHLSRYMRLKMKMPKKVHAHTGQVRKPYTMKKKPRKAYTPKDPVEIARKQKANSRGFRKY